MVDPRLMEAISGLSKGTAAMRCSAVKKRGNSGGGADNRVGPFLDEGMYLPVDLHVPGGKTFLGVPGMDMHYGRPGVGRPLGLLRRFPRV